MTRSEALVLLSEYQSAVDLGRRFSRAAGEVDGVLSETWSELWEHARDQRGRAEELLAKIMDAMTGSAGPG